MTKVSGLNLEDIENLKIQKLITQVPSFSWDRTWNTFIRLTKLVSNVISFVSAGYAIATQMSVWGIGIIFFVIPEAFFRFKYNIKIKQFRDSNAEKLKYANYIHSRSMYLSNFPELRVDNVFSSFIKSFKQTTESYYKRQNNIRKKRDLHAFFWSWFDASLKRLMQIILIPISIAQRYSIGTFKYLYDFIDNIYDSSWNVIWQCLMIKSNSLYVKDYFDLFEYQGFGDIASGNETLDPLTTPRLKFVNVSFNYPESPSAALSNISFTIEPGEKVAIIGHDNSGKSTTAKLLCGLYRVSPGDILIDKISIKNLARGELKNKISIVFENYIKYNFSIRKNITVTEPERDFNRRLYEEALEISEIKDLMDELLIDENQILGKMFGNGINISTGHWQRLAIARAIYRDRPILILDESFTQIDGFSRRPIMQKIIKHRPKQTFINITQDDIHTDLFDKIIYIEDG
ncbi:MAG: ATP-binding cassette domain-containing protein, partial [Patescibacteria group bacterium]|nr:ATP-binding cassette domain-containing protein [Patescibacteria group bacterium]